MSGTGDLTAIAARANRLREAYDKELAATRLKHHTEVQHLGQQAVAARAKADHADQQADYYRKVAADEQARLTKEAQRADELDRNGLTIEATTVREQVDTQQALVKATQARADEAKAEADAARAEAVAASARLKALDTAGPPQDAAFEAARQEIDDLENKAQYLREAQVHDLNVTRLEEDVAALRAAGDHDAADRKTQELVDERIAADAKRGSAEEIHIDEAKLRVLEQATTSPGPDALGAPVPDHLAQAPDDASAVDPVFGDVEVAAATTSVDPSGGTGAPTEGLDRDTFDPLATSDLEQAGTQLDGMTTDSSLADLGQLEPELTPSLDGGLDGDYGVGQDADAGDFTERVAASDPDAFATDDVDLGEGAPA